MQRIGSAPISNYSGFIIVVRSLHKQKKMPERLIAFYYVNQDSIWGC